MVLVVVCVYGQCEPLIFNKTKDDYYGYYDREGYGSSPFITDEWCTTNLAAFHIRDFDLVTPETKDIYYLDPRLVGFQGATYNPSNVVCWPTHRGPQ